MRLGSEIRKSLASLQLRWTRLAESAFRGSASDTRDETARGEFISAFISERELTFPRRSGSGHRQN